MSKKNSDNGLALASKQWWLEKSRKEKKNLWIIYLNSETSFVLSAALIKSSRTQERRLLWQLKMQNCTPNIYHHSQVRVVWQLYVEWSSLCIRAGEKVGNSINKQNHCLRDTSCLLLFYISLKIDLANSKQKNYKFHFSAL